MDSGLANDEEKAHEQNGQRGDYCPNHQRSSSCSMRWYARRLTRTTANVSDRCGQDGREDDHSARGRVVLGQPADEGHVNRHENTEDELQPPNLFLDAVDLCHVCSAET